MGKYLFRQKKGKPLKLKRLPFFVFLILALQNKPIVPLYFTFTNSIGSIS